MELGYSQGLRVKIGFLESQQKCGNLEIFKEHRTPLGEFLTSEVENVKHLLKPKMKNSATCLDIEAGIFKII